MLRALTDITELKSEGAAKVSIIFIRKKENYLPLFKGCSAH